MISLGEPLRLADCRGLRPNPTCMNIGEGRRTVHALGVCPALPSVHAVSAPASTRAPQSRWRRLRRETRSRSTGGLLWRQRLAGPARRPGRGVLDSRQLGTASSRSCGWLGLARCTGSLSVAPSTQGCCGAAVPRAFLAAHPCRARSRTRAARHCRSGANVGAPPQRLTRYEAVPVASTDHE